MALGLLAAGIGAGATIGSSALSYMGQREANQTNMAIAREQMSFQDRMSSTAHQRQVADLKKAGLNPILSASYGGASSPGGAALPVANEMAAVGSGVNSAFDNWKKTQEVKNIVEQNKNISSQTKLNNDLAAKAREDAKVSRANVGVATSNAKIAAAQVPKEQNKAAVEKTWLGKGAAYLDRITDSIGGMFRGGSSAASAYRDYKTGKAYGY